MWTKRRDKIINVESKVTTIKSAVYNGSLSRSEVSLKPGPMAYTGKLSPRETVAGGSEIQSYPWLSSEFKTSLGYNTFKKQKQNNNNKKRCI